MYRFRLNLLSILASSCLLAVAIPAHADPIAWTVWSPSSLVAGNPGSATGTLNGIAVTYTGEILGLQFNNPSWNPTSSFAGGTVGNAPPTANGAVQMEGGSSYVETITFASAITDPEIAIWSLGGGNTAAEFDFPANEPFTIEAGGPNAEYGGSSIYTNRNPGVSGVEGNGVVQINGTYTSITFTTPVTENYYDFTVGNDTAPVTSVTPEPTSLVLLGTGLAAIAGVRRKFRR